MSPLWRWRMPTNRTPMFKLPVFDHLRRNPLLQSLLQITAIIAGFLALLLIFGSPALRISYEWNGRENAPVYYVCTYFDLITGLNTFTATQLNGQCSGLMLVEVGIAELLALIP